MRHISLVLFFSAILSAASATPTVSNVTAKQRYPWNGLVDINCTVSGVSETTKRFEFKVAAVDSGSVHDISQFWVIKNGTNSTDHAVHADGAYHLVWDSKTDFDNQICSNMVMRVRVRESVQLWANGPYWATTNIGAEEPYESGYYFWWGDTVGYKCVNNAWVASNGSSSNFRFQADNTPTYNKSIATLQSEGWITSGGVLAPEHDAAHVHWGGNWRMPTEQELDGLNNNCDRTWTSMNGVNGYVVRGRGDYASNSIFLPAAGVGDGARRYYSGSEGHYWSSVPSSNEYSSIARGLFFYSSYHYTYPFSRDYGQSVRPLQGFTK